MKKLIGYYDKFEEYVLVGSLVFSVGLIFVQVIMRSIFNSSLSWSEELSRYIFIWQIWMGTSIALREDKHISVEMLPGMIKSQKGKDIVRIVGMIIWFVFMVLLVINGYELTQSMFMRNALSSGMNIPLYLVYIVLPISSLIVSLRLVGKIFQSVKNINKPGEGN